MFNTLFGRLLRKLRTNTYAPWESSVYTTFPFSSETDLSTCLYVLVCVSVCAHHLECVRKHVYACLSAWACVSVRVFVCVCLCLRGPFGLAKTSAPSYVRGLVWHLGNILYPALQHYTQFTAKGHYVPVNPLLIDISANSTTSQPHDRSLLPQNQKITILELKIER